MKNGYQVSDLDFVLPVRRDEASEMILFTSEGQAVAKVQGVKVF